MFIFASWLGTLFFCALARCLDDFFELPSRCMASVGDKGWGENLGFTCVKRRGENVSQKVGFHRVLLLLLIRLG